MSLKRLSYKNEIHSAAEDSSSAFPPRPTRRQGVASGVDEWTTPVNLPTRAPTTSPEEELREPTDRAEGTSFIDKPLPEPIKGLQ